MDRLQHLALPRAAPRRVLACGAHLKNTACLLHGRVLTLSPLHGDLSTPQACRALAHAIPLLLQCADGHVDAVAHDLHPDFESTRLAQRWAGQLGVPAIAVQHHHAHIAAVQAEHGVAGAVIGVALDGMGLGSDGSAWGGEVLHVDGGQMQRVDHLAPLRLPGGDIAAQEPWRMAAAALHAAGRAAEIVPRFGPVVGERVAALLVTMLDRGLNCPPTTSAGRWFDAAAGLLGLSVRQAAEAEAAVALERLATEWLAHHAPPPWAATPADPARPGLDLLPLVLSLPTCASPAEAAARFHAGLAQTLAAAALQATALHGTRQVALAGGCFHNRVLTRLLREALQAGGCQVLLPQRLDCGDAGVAAGQAWAAAHMLPATGRGARPEVPACA